MSTLKKIVSHFIAIVLLSGIATLSVSSLVPAAASASPLIAQTQVCKSPGDACTNFVQKYLNPFIRLLSMIVGVGAAISLVLAGIRYSSSADDPSAVSKAKTRIVQTIIGLLAYIFLFAFLNYVIPGGLI